MTKDQVIAELRAAIAPLANEPTKEEGEKRGVPMMCDLTDDKMDAVILRARAALALVPELGISIH